MTVARFWREQKNRYNLLGAKCGNCNRYYFPPREICIDCHRKSFNKIETVKLSGKGEIITYTIVHDAPDAFKMQIPYVMAIVELEEGPMVTAQIVNAALSGQGHDQGHDNDHDYNYDHDHDKDNDAQNPEGECEYKEIAIGSKVASVFRKISEDGKSGTIHYGYKFKLI